MGVYLIPSDLAAFATIPEPKALAMIEDAEAMAALAAPCITSAEFQAAPANMAAVKAVLRSAVLRWHDAGNGAIQQTQVGPFGQSVDTRQVRRAMFWPTEIEQLRDLCAAFAGTASSGAFGLDMAPSGGTAHLSWCSLSMGAAYCSCGADIASVPIYELG